MFANGENLQRHVSGVFDHARLASKEREAEIMSAISS